MSSRIALEVIFSDGRSYYHDVYPFIDPSTFAPDTFKAKVVLVTGRYVVSVTEFTTVPEG